MEDLLQVGVITQTHGIRGEVKVFPTTDDVKRFKKCKELILDTGREQIRLEVQSVKFFKQFVILKFKGYDNINEIEKYLRMGLYVTRENAIPLKKDEYFIADLIGLTVVDEENQEIGILKEVLQTGANDVYVIHMDDGKEVLIPAIAQCVQKVDLQEKKMYIHKMKGLFES